MADSLGSCPTSLLLDHIFQRSCPSLELAEEKTPLEGCSFVLDPNSCPISWLILPTAKGWSLLRIIQHNLSQQIFPLVFKPHTDEK